MANTIPQLPCSLKGGDSGTTDARSEEPESVRLARGGVQRRAGQCGGPRGAQIEEHRRVDDVIDPETNGAGGWLHVDAGQRLRRRVQTK